MGRRQSFIGKLLSSGKNVRSPFAFGRKNKNNPMRLYAISRELNVPECCGPGVGVHEHLCFVINLNYKRYICDRAPANPTPNDVPAKAITHIRIYRLHHSRLFFLLSFGFLRISSWTEYIRSSFSSDNCFRIKLINNPPLHAHNSKNKSDCWTLV